MRLSVAWVGMLMGLAWIAPVSAAPREHPASADLIADASSVQPGEVFQVALRITLQPGWHVYWINPGDSGLATKVTFKAPDGYKIEPLGYPTPIGFNQPGDIAGYGYEGSLLLMARVTVPADAKPGTTVEVTADANWLVCKDICIPGRSTAALQMPIAQTTKRANESLFADWSARLPVPAEQKAEVTKSENTLQLKWREPVKNVQVFTAPGDAWWIKETKLTGDERTTKLVLVPEAVTKSPEPVEMPVVIAYDDPSGQRRSVQLIHVLKK